MHNSTCINRHLRWNGLLPCFAKEAHAYTMQNNLSSFITIKGTELKIVKHPEKQNKTKPPGPYGQTGDSYQTFKAHTSERRT